MIIALDGSTRSELTICHSDSGSIYILMTLTVLEYRYVIPSSLVLIKTSLLETARLGRTHLWERDGEMAQGDWFLIFITIDDWTGITGHYILASSVTSAHIGSVVIHLFCCLSH